MSIVQTIVIVPNARATPLCCYYIYMSINGRQNNILLFWAWTNTASMQQWNGVISMSTQMDGRLNFQWFIDCGCDTHACGSNRSFMSTSIYLTLVCFQFARNEEKSDRNLVALWITSAVNAGLDTDDSINVSLHRAYSIAEHIFHPMLISSQRATQHIREERERDQDWTTLSFTIRYKIFNSLPSKICRTDKRNIFFRVLTLELAGCWNLWEVVNQRAGQRAWLA